MLLYTRWINLCWLQLEYKICLSVATNYNLEYYNSLEILKQTPPCFIPRKGNRINIKIVFMRLEIINLELKNLKKNMV